MATSGTPALLLVFMSTVICYSHSEYSSEKYIFDVDNGLGRRFDGIGAISGGGVSFYSTYSF